MPAPPIPPPDDRAGYSIHIKPSVPTITSEPAPTILAALDSALEGGNAAVERTCWHITVTAADGVSSSTEVLRTSVIAPDWKSALLHFRRGVLGA